MGDVHDDSVSSAREAGLIYVSDRDPGIQRVSRGRGFGYVDAHGKAVRDAKTLERIRSLVIPPGWRDVWICARANGHLQVTARDARGRKQYRYHPRYREHRENGKYEGLVAFAEGLPRIRQRVRRDLRLRGLPRERVLATLVTLLDRTSIRVGNAEYARDNQSYGLTTLKDRHAQFKGDTLRLRFKGKSGVEHELELSDRRLAAIVQRCQDLPGQELFQYLDEEDSARPIDSAMVNGYLRDVSGSDVTAKHFRTWHGTVQAALQLSKIGTAESETGSKRNVVAAIKEVAALLGNRPATCRKYYVHPAVLDTYEDGTLTDYMASGIVPRRRNLSSAEVCVLALLRRALAPARRKRAA